MSQSRTRRYTIEDVTPVVSMLQKGGLVALPTETVYGLAADAENSAAVMQLFAIKHRPREQAMSVLVTGMDMVERYCENIPAAAYTLAERYWPGPLTMILEDKGVVTALVNDEGDTLGVRCPDHPVTQVILAQANVGLAAPSANPTGLPSPKTAQEVLDYFDNRIEGVLDAGTCQLGVESTVVDLTGEAPEILREGAIPAQEILDVLEGKG